MEYIAELSILLIMVPLFTVSSTSQMYPYNLDVVYRPQVAKRGAGGQQQAQQELSFKGARLAAVTVVSRGADVVLECEVGGNPSPTIHWLRDGQRIQQGYSLDFQDDTPVYENEVNAGAPSLQLGKVKAKLYIDCVADSGVAKYTCVAETAEHRIAQTTELVIGDAIPEQTRGNCLTKKAYRGEPARIYLWTAIRIQFEERAVQLMCRADGYPKPAITWRKSEDGPEIQDDGIHKVLPSGDLLISDINWFVNMGNYYCKAENEAGIDQQSTFLYPTVP